jgi:hypothetical protein
MRHGDSRNANESILGLVGILGVADQGKALGATSWRRRLPAMHLVSISDPNPGRAPQREVAAPVMCMPTDQYTK